MTDLLLCLTAIHLRKFKTKKNSSKGDGFALLGCYALRFHEKNYLNSKQRKVRENVLESNIVTMDGPTSKYKCCVTYVTSTWNLDRLRL